MKKLINTYPDKDVYFFGWKNSAIYYMLKMRGMDTTAEMRETHKANKYSDDPLMRLVVSAAIGKNENITDNV